MIRKFISKIVAVGIAASVMCSAAVPAFAATKYENSIGSVAEDITNPVKIGQDKTQSQQSEYQDVSDFVQSSTCNVYATIAEGSDVINPDTGDIIDGSILVSVPKKLILGKNTEGNAYEGTYKVRVKGNIAGDTVISVIPESTFSMHQVGKQDITVNVSQPKQKFVTAQSTLIGEDVVKGVEADFNEVAVTTGKMFTKEATAGSWNGICNFNISMTSIA